MKKLLVLLLALLMLAPCALAQIEDTASTVRTADLLDTPREGAQVLMRYYTGVRVEVLREADTRYVQVNVGAPGGSLTGYMRKDDLVFGEENVRLNRPLEVCYEQTGWTMYGYCDTRSEVLIPNGDSYLYVMGEYGDWAHAIFSSGSEDTTGFVNLTDDAIPEMKRRTRYAGSIRTEPTGSEPTREEAIAYAKARNLEDHVMANGGDAEVTEEMLDACEATVDVFYVYDSDDPYPLYYLVQFFYTDRAWGDGFPMICAVCCLYVEDGEIVTYDYGKG